MADVAVIGAGLTGLGTAWQIQEAGHRVTVYEQSSRVGGNIHTVQEGGFLVEEGPNTIQLANSENESWLQSTGLGSVMIDADPGAAKRYLVRHGGPIAVPGSPLGFLRTPLFSWKAKIRLVGELFARKAPKGTDETLATFVRRRLGQEMLDYAINPFVGGVYAGDPVELSVRYGFPKLYRLEQNHRSLILGTMALGRERKRAGTAYKTRLVSFPDGLQALPDQLAANLQIPVRLSTRVINLRRTDRWEVQTEQDSSGTERYDAVVVALPATALAGLPINGAVALASLEEIDHPPVVTYAMGFARDQVTHPLDGFGALIPAKEPFRILGSLFSSSLFAGRAPEGHVLLTTFLGGTRAPALARLPQEEVRAIILEDLNRLLGISGEPVFEHQRLWSRAIPQYKVGHGRFIDTMRTVERKNPGLKIGGNSRDGISLSYCLEGSRRLTRETLEAL